MESLDNLEPYDYLEDWSNDVDLFMEAMCHPPHMADVLWQEAKLKKQKEEPLFASQSSMNQMMIQWNALTSTTTTLMTTMNTSSTAWR